MLQQSDCGKTVVFPVVGKAHFACRGTKGLPAALNHDLVVDILIFAQGQCYTLW